MNEYGVYVKTDSQGRVVAINSSALLPDTTGWIKIDEGDGDRYHHAQGNYLPGRLIDEKGRYRYKLVDGKVVERTPEELAADALPASEPAPTIEQRTAALETATQQQAEALNEVVTILEAIV